MKKILLSLLIVLIAIIKSFAQDPKIIPPSPNAASLNRYLEYPVSNSTGIPDINIPIYQVSSGSLSVPISISYHASGRRVSDQTGAIGIGWALNAGGMISRTIYGEPDDGVYQFADLSKVVEAVTDVPSFTILAGITHDSQATPYDSEYDIFNYFYPGGSGNFVLKDLANIKTPIPIPYSSIKIVPVKSATADRFASIEITDLQGIVYRYGHSVKGNGEYEEFFGGTQSGSPSGWMLTEIISANKQDTIAFAYQGINKSSDSHSYSYWFRDDFPQDSQTGIGIDPISTFDLYQWHEHESSVPNGSTYYIQRLKEIKYNRGRVVFNLADGASDPDRLVGISVFDNQNNLLRSVDFKQSILDQLTPLHHPSEVKKLDTIVFKDKDARSVENYAFEYYPGINGGVNFDDRGSADLWGYYNGGPQNDYQIPNIDHVSQIGSSGSEVSSTVGLGSNRNADASSAMAGVLKKITYPTKGTAEFTYEGNKYLSSDASVKNGPGLRIAEIKSVDNNGKTLIKTYKYGLNECGYGIIPFEPDLHYMIKTLEYFDYANDRDPSLVNYWNVYFREQTISSDFPSELSFMIQKPVGYTNVSEYNEELPVGSTPSYGKVLYTYDVKNYAPADRYPLLGSIQTAFNYRITDYNLWAGNYLKQKTTFKYTNVTAGFEKVQDESYQYHEAPQNQLTLTGLQAIKVLEPINNSSFNYGAFGTNLHLALNFHLQSYAYGNYTIGTGNNILDSKSITDYSSNISQVTAYTYNSDMQVSTETMTDSKNANIITSYKYPRDYPGTLPYSTMLSKNILSPVVEKSEARGSATNIVNTVHTDYADWGNNNFLPQTANIQVGNNTPEARMAYKQYGIDGSLLEYAKSNGPSVSYIWDQYNYPVAEVKNAPANDIFYEGFENFYGNTGDARTGHRSFTGPYNKVLTGLDPGSYTLSYWKKAYSMWVWVTSKVTVSGSTYTISLPANQIDDVRFYPAAAQMATYTNDPLVGVTSVTDAKGQATYYEYDGYQRLMNIRDKDKNIIKSFCYNYIGQNGGGCYINQAPPYTNVAQSSSFTTNCSAGFQPSVVTYTVPAGVYSSTASQASADAQATNDRLANGQNYANTFGTCSPLSTFIITNNTYASYTVAFNGPTVQTVTVGSTGTNIQVLSGSYQSVTITQLGDNTSRTFLLGNRPAITGTAVSPGIAIPSVNITAGHELTLTIN